MNKAIVRLRQDTDKAISAKLTAQEIIETIYPRVLTALDDEHIYALDDIA